MSKLNTFILTTTFLASLLAATPASADFCIQLDGALSGDLGFFRFQGSMPHAKGAIKALTGRVAALSPAFGAATVAKDGRILELGVTFFSDATQGQFNIFMQGPKYLTGEGYADYGTYGVNNNVTATVVSCRLEPAGL